MENIKEKSLKKGSITVESVLIMPLIIVIIIFVIQTCIVHYQNIVVSAEAMRLASRAGGYWQDIGRSNPPVFQEMTEESSAKDWISDASFKNHEPYNSILELLNFGHTKQKIENAQNYAKRVMNKVPNLTSEGDTVDKDGVAVTKDQGLLQTYITVTVTKKNLNPLGNLYKKWGFKSNEEHTITAKGIQIDNTEFIRNVSFIYDIAKGEFK